MEGGDGGWLRVQIGSVDQWIAVDAQPRRLSLKEGELRPREHA